MAQHHFSSWSSQKPNAVLSFKLKAILPCLSLFFPLFFSPFTFLLLPPLANPVCFHLQSIFKFAIPHHLCLYHPSLSHHPWLALLIGVVSLLVYLLSDLPFYNLFHTVASDPFKLWDHATPPSQNRLVLPHLSKIPPWSCHLLLFPSLHFLLLDNLWTYLAVFPSQSIQRRTCLRCFHPFPGKFFLYVHITPSKVISVKPSLASYSLTHFSKALFFSMALII